MNIRDLKYLVALEDLRHFGKAAKACFVSQPTLSMQIKKLEETLGVQLLERTNKSVLLTDIGKVVAERARQILSQIDEIRHLADQLQDPYSGELKMGVIPTVAPYLLPHIIPKLSAAFPKLSLYLLEEQTLSLVEKLKHGKIHAAILALPVPEPRFSHIPLFEEEFLLAVSRHHPLAKNKTIKQRDLVDNNLLLLEEGHCMREQSLELCNRMHVSENANFQGTSLETLRHMVIAQAGITLMPQLACKPSKAVHYIPFSSPKPTRTLALFWRTMTDKKRLIEGIADHIQKTMMQHAFYQRSVVGKKKTS